MLKSVISFTSENSCKLQEKRVQGNNNVLKRVLFLSFADISYFARYKSWIGTEQKIFYRETDNFCICMYIIFERKIEFSRALLPALYLNPIKLWYLSKTKVALNLIQIIWTKKLHSHRPPDSQNIVNKATNCCFNRYY